MAEPTPAWVECDLCGDYLCTIHNTHVADCDCQPIEEWVEKGQWPYAIPEGAN